MKKIVFFLSFFAVVFNVFSGSAWASSSSSSDPEQAQDLGKHVHNLMWIYKESGLDEGHLSPEGRMVTQAESWAGLNPDVEIHIHYDSEFVTEDSLGGTLHRILSSDFQQQIFLRDVRDIPIVAENPTAFLSNQFIECRTDLLRCIISHQDLVSGDFLFSSYSDLDVTPRELTSVIQEKSDDLKSYGMVMLKEDRKHSNGRNVKWENSFHIFYQDKNFLKCLHDVLIQPSISHLRLISYLRNQDNDFANTDVAKKTESLLKRFGQKDMKSVFNLDGLYNKEYVYTRYEKVLGATHNAKGRAVNCLAVMPNSPLFLMDFAHCRVMAKVPGGFQTTRSNSISMEFLLFCPLAEFGISPSQYSGPLIIQEDNRLFVPTTNALQCPPSQILTE